MKKILTFLMSLVLSLTLFSQAQVIRTDSCGDTDDGMTMFTWVDYNEETKDYTIRNTVISKVPIIDTIYYTCHDTIQDTLQSLTNIPPGVYRSKFVNDSGCTIENEGWIWIDGHELIDVEPIILKVYPNPFVRTLVVRYDVPIMSNYFLVITSVSNYAYEYHRQLLDPYTRQVSIDCSMLPRGQYVIRVINLGEVVDRKKVIKFRDN